MNKDTAIIECTLGTWAIETSTPAKQYRFEWKLDASCGKHVCEVPMQLAYNNVHGKEVITIENLPQHLLNNYKHLRLFKHKKRPLIVQPEIVDPNVATEDTASKTKGK